jgi:hypothetical protein
MHRFTYLVILFLLLGCGGPSEADIEATIAVAVQSTAQSAQVATSVQATTQAAEVCGQIALNTYADEIEEQIITFEMQTSVAGSTPRMSLGVALQELLNLQTETRRMKAPECLSAYHERVVSMMGLYRLAYETFAAQGDEMLVQAALQVGDETLGEVKQQLAIIRNGQVPPTPLPQTPPVP